MLEGADCCKENEAEAGKHGEIAVLNSGCDVIKR